MSTIVARLRARIAAPIASAALITALVAISIVPVALISSPADAVQSTGGSARFPMFSGSVGARVARG